MPSPFKNYPPFPRAHPDRPWWRMIIRPGSPAPTNGGWQRTDGHAVRSWPDALEIDRDNPLPAPAPRVGQVWSIESGGRRLEIAIRLVVYNTDGSVEGYLTTLAADDSLDPDTSWPIGGASLVAGPGAPWAPCDDATPAHPPAT